MKVTSVPGITGAFLFEPTLHVDERGFFSRTFGRDTVRSAGIDPDGFVQDSISRSHRGIVRGLHIRSGAGWPLPVTLISARDKEALSIAEATRVLR